MRRLLHVAVLTVTLFAFSLPVSAHTYSSSHHPCVNPPFIHGIAVDSTYWGHSSSYTSSIWPGANYDRITNHYFRSSSHGSWQYQNYTRSTCWT